MEANDYPIDRSHLLVLLLPFMELTPIHQVSWNQAIQLICIQRGSP